MKWSIRVTIAAAVLLGAAAASAQRDPADRSLRLDEDAIRTDVRRDRLEQADTPPLGPRPSQVVPKPKAHGKPKRTGSANQP
jgi:hypothetical protein